MTSKSFNLVAPIVIGGLMVFSGALVWQLPAARGHDHNRPDLNKWFMSLYSNHGALCCDGSEAMHLSNVEWTAPDSTSHHYRVKIPVSAETYDRARHGAVVDTMWVDVPDDAVVNQPNREGSALVWPAYGPTGGTVRCFMPGAEG
jgi:hypothetical protein